jgi:UDP-N-acetylmuramoyl-tripeptide--D-alanyl-D-alanine ligase
MIRFDIRMAARQLGCDWRGISRDFIGVAIDSRQVKHRELFVALSGDYADGHNYLADAAAKGAVVALVERWQDVDLPQILCPDAVIALGQLASAWRTQCDARLVAITGSNGKTTVKGMLASICNDSERCLATEGNYNNELGLPLTLCRLSREHRVAILEMGASKPGDITYLSNIARPQIGLITNAGPAHLKGMGDIEGVAQVKGELITGLAAEGVAILNADDDFFDTWKELAGDREIMTFGLDQPADVSGSYQSSGELSRLELRQAGASIELQLQTQGRHNARNALAAAAAALALGHDLDQIKQGLERFTPVSGRLFAKKMPAGWTLIEDSYNANPASLKAGLATLAEQSGERWLVLGDMAELGPDSAALHFQSGAEARRLGVARLFCTGEMTRHTVSGFGSEAEFFDDRKALVKRFKEDVHADVICLVKGSRSMQMEKVAAAIAAGE